MTTQTTLAAAIAASNAAHSPGTGTQIYKHRDGWRAEDRIPLGPAKGSMGRDGERVLHVDTHKGTRGLLTHASVMVHTPDGSMSCVLFGDFSLRLVTSTQRCTERSIREYAGSLPDRVLAFYAAKEKPAQAAPSALDPQFAPALAEAGCAG